MNVGTWDPKWGALITNMQEEGFNSAQIEEAKKSLSAVINRTTSVTAETQAIYAKVMPKNRKEIVKKIKEELLTYTEQKINEILAGASNNFQESFIEDALLKMEQLGKPDAINWYFYHIYSTHSESKTKVEKMVSDLFRDFASGAPTSLPLVSAILSRRYIGHVKLAHVWPVSDISLSFQILQRLADLGVSHARGRLGWAYDWNKIGEENLGLSMENRLEGVRKLALAGHAMSQYYLGYACFHKKLGHDSIHFMDEGVRRGWIQELWNHEVPHNYYLTSIVGHNRIGDLPYGLSVKQRFNILLNRAKNGDVDAFNVLFKAYKNNQIDENDPSLNLTQEERKNKIEELKTVNPGLYNTCMAPAYRDNLLGDFEFHFSDAERLKWLEEYNHSQLIDAYAQNRLIPVNGKASIALNMSLERRIAKLVELANKGFQSAQLILLQYYRYDSWSDVTTIVSDPQEAEVPNPLTPQHLLRWALNGGTHNCVMRYVCELTRQEEAITYLFSVRTTLQRLD